jgi:hypothetical protein
MVFLATPATTKMGEGNLAVTVVLRACPEPPGDRAGHMSASFHFSQAPSTSGGTVDRGWSKKGNSRRVKPLYHFRITEAFVEADAVAGKLFILNGELAGIRTQDPRLKRARASLSLLCCHNRPVKNEQNP